MKFQDIVFFIVFFILFFFKRSAKTFIVFGIGCFFLAIPLFYLWIFFSAERLVWYAAAFILTGIMLLLSKR